jgi:hypothetical protein
MEKKSLRTSEEIDLAYYLEEIRQGLAKIRRLILNYFRLLWKKKFLFFLIVLLITGGAYCLRFVSPPAYRTEAIFISSFLPSDYYGIMIRDLDQLIREGNVPVLAEQLRVSPEVAAQFSRIELSALGDIPPLRNDMGFPPFGIRIILKKMDHLEAIQEGFLFYLEGGELERNKRLEWIKSLEEARAMLYRRIKKSDSLVVANPKDVEKAFDPGMQNKSGRSEVQELIRVNELLLAPKKIEIVRPFLRKLKPNYPNYRQFLIDGLLIALLAAFVLTPLANGKKMSASNKAE